MAALMIAKECAVIFKNAAVKLLSMRRFSLRTFLILVLLLGCGFGILARWHRTVIIPGDAQLRIQARSGNRPKLISNPPRQISVTFGVSHTPDHNSSWLKPFLRKWIHSEYDRRFDRVSFLGVCVDDLELAKDFASSNGVREAWFDVERVTPDFAAEFFRTQGIRELHFQSIPADPRESELLFRSVLQSRSLESISLDGSFLCEEAAIEIAKLPKLNKLKLDSCTPETLCQFANCNSLQSLSIRSLRSNANDFRATDESEEMFAERARRCLQKFLAEVSNSPNLKTLGIGGTLGITPNDLHDFCANSQVENLGLSDPSWSPECLAEIARLPRLESLRLCDLNLKDEHLTMLHQARSLKSLTIGPNVSPEAIKALRAALPNCKVGHY